MFLVCETISASSKGGLQGVLTKFILTNFINFELGFGGGYQMKTSEIVVIHTKVSPGFGRFHMRC